VRLLGHYRFLSSSSSDKSLLHRIADALEVARSTDIRAQRNDVILEINRLLATSQDMDSLSGKISGVTGRCS
jgi:hypothetical protein